MNGPGPLSGACPGPFAVVGPSGAGKDTLMEAARAADPSVVLVRRVVTRPEAAGGEDFQGVTRDGFARMKADGAFALDWEAHGLSYGIPAGLHDDIAAGRKVLFNGSRAMLGEAARVFPGLHVLHVTANDRVLADRLRARGRESEADIAARLARARLPLPGGLNVTEIDNSGALDTALAALLEALQPVRA